MPLENAALSPSCMYTLRGLGHRICDLVHITQKVSNRNHAPGLAAFNAVAAG